MVSRNWPRIDGAKTPRLNSLVRHARIFFAWICLVLTATAATNEVTTNSVAEAEKLIGLRFTPAKREMMLKALRAQVKKFDSFRQADLPYDTPPAVVFNPIPAGMKLETQRKKCKWSRPGKVELPADLNNLAFDSIGQLAALIKARKITSVQLTELYLARLKKYGPKLNCVVTLTEDLAREQARAADREIAAGKYRGPLQGIPYGVKDLLSTKEYKTTWGSGAFKDQAFDKDATVVRKLEEAGAVLVAKLSTGELAMDDVWFGGQTKNPWDPTQGSGGSSAGPASATAAGLVGFSIGSETYGSIVIPCTICGATGLRPTYGRVSRNGAMPLSWTMDKIGPICRSVEDCAMVLNAIRGPDGVDQSVVDAPFNYRPKIKLSNLRIGYLADDFGRERDNTNDFQALQTLRSLGANLVPIQLPDFPKQITIVIRAEGATEFDDMIRGGRDDLLTLQGEGDWGNTFRESRFIPAVEYLRAQRLRYKLIQDMARLMENIDVFVAPSDADDNSRLTNLTGHPCVVVPDGFTTNGLPTSICFVGKLFGEAGLLAVAKTYQDATGFHLRHPKLGE